MKAKDIRDAIMSFTNDVLLDYPNNDVIFINPCSDNKFIFSYKDIDKTYTNIDDLMSDKIYDGKSLTEIASKVTLL